ncbi:hypothetical protein BGX26_003049 [Mortierella sp. AD094]|nr:hypothetical protein BGX26_003049 [Mortierella sp. AD094]
MKSRSTGINPSTSKVTSDNSSDLNILPAEKTVQKLSVQQVAMADHILPLELPGDTAALTSSLTGFRNKSVPPKATWRNWIGNYRSAPVHIFHPTTLEDIRAIVWQAIASHQKIRCVAGGFSMSSITTTSDFLVDTRGLVELHKPTFSERHNSWTVKVQSGVTIKDLDDFLRKQDPPLAMPSNVLLGSVCYGGIIAAGTHGAEVNSRSLSDQVTEITIVDGTGTLQTFTAERDAHEFSAACLNLGLFGIIYTITLKVISMADTRYHVRDVILDYKDYFSPKNKSCGPALKKLVQGNALIEIFYLPSNQKGDCSYNDKIWAKTWNPTARKPNSNQFFDKYLRPCNQIWLMKLLKVVFRVLRRRPHWTPQMCRLIYREYPFLDRVQEIPYSLHFLKRIDGYPSWLSEFSIKCNDDYSNVVEAWDKVVVMLYEYANEKSEFPLNLAMEMRFNKASGCIMSPIYDPDPEAIFCSMELTSARKTPGFLDFKVLVAQDWMKNYQALPHWAKLWEGIDGVMPHIQMQMKSRLEDFDQVRRRYDPTDMFMTPLFDQIL